MAASDRATSGAIGVRRLTGPGLDAPAGATYTKALVMGDEIVVSGLTAAQPDGSIAGGDDTGEQARAILRQLISIVEAAGGHAGNIYKIVVYVTDISKRAEINAARAEILKPLYPCSTLVEVKALAAPGWLVEIDAFANLRVDLHAAAEYNDARS